MAYIGKTPVIGNFVKLDSITVVNGQAAYTMQNGGANFTSYDNVNQFLVSLNGILQSPTDSFTVSGSTLTFASNLSTGDVIDFVLVLGNTLDIGTPSDNTVSTAKIVDGAVTAAKATGFGKIAQVVQAVKTDTASTSSSFADTGLSASITPSSSSSKVLVLCTLGGVSGANTSFKGKLVRGSTDIFVGDSASNRPQASAAGQTSDNYEIQQLVMNFLDSPSTTSSTTYKAQFGSNGSVTIYLNRTSRDNDGSAEDARSASSIILMEVLA